MKPLPSLKERKRYVLVKVISKESKTNKILFTYPEIKQALESTFQEFFGTLGLSRAAIKLLGRKFDKEEQTLPIKVAHKHVDELKAALALVKKVKGSSVIVRSLTTSGTVKKVNKK